MPHSLTRTLFVLLATSLLAWGCTKQENVYVPDNEAPPDTSVSTLKLETYVNKCYIGLLGRKPSDTELTDAIQTLRDSSLSAGGRILLLDGLLSQEEFLIKTYLNDATVLLNEWDTALFAFYLDRYILARQDTNNAAIYDLLDTTILHQQRLLAIPTDLLNGTIDIKTMHFRMVDNFMYDDINMGSENLVRSMFDHFLLRYPTASELAQGVTMVDGFEAIVFLQTGESRYDFTRIFFNSDGYYEGQVRWAFERFLYRDATTEELAYYTNLYRQTGSQSAFFSVLLSTNEYAGF